MGGEAYESARNKKFAAALIKHDRIFPLIRIDNFKALLAVGIFHVIRGKMRRDL